VDTWENVNRILAVVCKDLAGSPTDFAIVNGQLMRGGDCNGDLINPRLPEAEMMVEVADAVQSFMSWNVGDRVWPTCPTHNFGLHPEVSNGMGVWRCKPRDHVVAPIGRLLSSGT
jgi:hypothetical protein